VNPVLAWLLSALGWGATLTVIALFILSPVMDLRTQMRRPEVTRRRALAHGLASAWLAAALASLIFVIATWVTDADRPLMPEPAPM
jgi:hypothetical protein